MIPPTPPSNEPERLAKLQALDVLDTPAEERFDRITRLARGLFDVPIALISLVDGDRQWFKSKQGLTVCETSREVSFCGHAILDEGMLVVEDALLDKRFRDNPLVADEPGIRFYAGYPLRDAEGLPMGTLCLIDVRPRTFHNSARALLRDLGTMAAGELRAMKPETDESSQAGWTGVERRRMLDEVTGAWNGEGIVEILRRELESAAQAGRASSVVIARMDEAANLCNTWVRTGAAVLMAEAAQALRSSVRSRDPIGTMGGRFLIVLPGCDSAGAAQRVAQFESLIAENSVLLSLGITMSFGFASTDQVEGVAAAQEMIQRAQAALNAGGERPARAS